MEYGVLIPPGARILHSTLIWDLHLGRKGRSNCYPWTAALLLFVNETIILTWRTSTLEGCDGYITTLTDDCVLSLLDLRIGRYGDRERSKES
jgi:hypothetical protein